MLIIPYLCGKINMTKTDRNSGGKKFQGRQEGEKRLRKNEKIAKEVKSDKKSYGSKREGFKSTEGRKKVEDSAKGSRGKFGADKPYGDKTKSSSGPYSKTRSFDKPYAKSSDSPRSFDKKKSGDKPYSKTSDTGRSYDKSKSNDRPYTKSSDTGRSYDKSKSSDRPYAKTSDSGRSTGGYSKNRTGDKPYSKAGAVRKSIGKAKYNSESASEKVTNYRSNDGRKKIYDKNDEGNKAVKNYKGSKREKTAKGSDLENANDLLNSEARLNRYIANSGICSRREADVLIAQGLVVVNGKPVTELGTKVMPGDQVRVDGKKISPEKPVYILLNKPKGYITTMDDPQGRRTIMELIDLPGRERIYPVGRLDRNTSGVLLLTNDGELTQKLMHPSFEIKKVYKAKLDRKPSKEHMLAWVNGVELEDGYMAFDQIGFVDPEDETTLGLEVTSGRNRIVRRMFEFFDYEVEGLDRVLLGEFDKVKLGRGKWRFLSEKEIKYIEKLKRMKPKKK